MNRACVLLLLLSFGLRANNICETGDRDLREGIDLANLYNWHDAEAKFHDAQRELSRCGNVDKALLAKVGYLRSTMEQRNLPELSRELNRLLSTAPADPLLRMWIYIAKGDIDNDLEFPALAKSDWESVKHFARESQNPQWLHRAEGELAIPAFYRGDVNNSRLLVTSALKAATDSNDYASQVRLLTHIGTVYEMWQQYAAGLTRLDQALAIAHDHPDVGYPVNVQEGRVMGLIGEHKFEQAEGLAKEIIAAMQVQLRGVNEAQTRVMLASLYRKQKRLNDALEQLSRAVSIARAGDYRIALADAEASLADVYATQGDVARAESYARQALATTRSSGVLSDLPNRMQELADVEGKEGKYGPADLLYRQAADLVDAQILSAPISARPLLLKAMSQVYTHHFALLALHKPDVLEEYAVVERVRGRSMASLLHSGIPPDSPEAAAVEKEISSLRLKLAHADSQTEIAQLRQQIFFTEHKRWLDRSELTVVRRPDRILTVPAVQRALGPQDLILEYVQTADRAYVLVISAKKLRCVSLPGTAAEITALADRFVTAIKQRTPATDEGRELWNTILGPVTEVRTHSNLIIIPDGELYTVPFGALVEPNGTRTVESHTIVRTPSASIYVLLHNRASDRAKGGLLSVGGVTYSADVQKIAKLRGHEGGDLFNLPASEDEVKAAVDALGSHMNHVELADTRATETAFKDSGLNSFSVIHLAVHGISDNTAAEKAALVLLPDPTREEDGILEIPEIVRLQLHSDLVVLSACETGVGVIQGEDGVSDLSRSFLLAGSRSVVATLWRVDDTFAAVLMKHFYQELASGRLVAEALTNAQRAILNDYHQSAVPFYWAGFITEGSGNVTLGSVITQYAAGRNATPAVHDGMPQRSGPYASH